MSIAFPAFLIFLIVLPGIILRYAYLRGRSISNPFVISSFTDEIAYGVFGAAILHTIWCASFWHLGHPVDYKSVLVLLIGSYGEHQEYLKTAMSSMVSQVGWIAAYFLSLYVASGAIGLLAHELVRHFKLDHRFQLLRFRNEWYYLLSGEYAELPEQGSTAAQPDLVYLSTVVAQGSQTYLYRGYIADYYFDRSGNLDRVVLRDAMRRLLTEDRPSGTEHAIDGDERFYSIVGDRFVLKYSEMQTINIQGISFSEE